MNHDQNKNRDKKDKSRNPDPITGAPGSHPVGTGIGAAAGGAAAGAAVGSVAGPVGTIAGAAAGAIVGGLAGKAVAEKIDPTRENTYWQENHPRQGWATVGSYDQFSGAYRAGYEGYGRYGVSGKTFEESEEEIRRNYEKDSPVVTWTEARPACVAAWNHVCKIEPKDTSVDTYGNPKKA